MSGFSALAANFGHMTGITAYSHTAFAAGSAGFFGIELVRSTFGMCSLTAFTCNCLLLFRVHSRKATVRSFTYMLMCTYVTVIHNV